jgi:aldehyde dehydrogenase (NAD+)
VSPQGGTTVNIINPATEQPVGRISLATSAEVDVAVKAARAAFKTFSLTTPKQRSSSGGV